MYQVGLHPLPKEQECQWDFTPSPRSRSASGTSPPPQGAGVPVGLHPLHNMDKDTGFGHEALSPDRTIARIQLNISQHCPAQHDACVWPQCCDMLGVVGSSLTNFKLEPTTPNMSQHGGQTHATRAQQSCDMLSWHLVIVWLGL